MALAKLEKTEWQAYFDAVTKALTGTSAEIEVDALSLGSQLEAEWLPLLGLAYDPKGDVIEILLEGGMDHLIHQPRVVYVEREGVRFVSLEVIDDDDVRTIVKFREPLMLPP